MRAGFVVCVDCGGVLRGDIYEDGTIIPTGVDRCPDCGGEDWREFVDVYDGWPSEEE